LGKATSIGQKSNWLCQIEMVQNWGIWEQTFQLPKHKFRIPSPFLFVRSRLL
jgi:hypothetical protein